VRATASEFLRFELFACRERLICRDPLFRVMNCRCELTTALAQKGYMSTSPILVIQSPVAALTDSVRPSPFMRDAIQNNLSGLKSIEHLPTCASSQTWAGQEGRFYAGNRCRDARGLPELQHVSPEIHQSRVPASWRPEVPILGASTLRGDVTKKHSRPMIAYGMLSVDGPQQSGGRTSPQGRRSQSTKGLCDDGPCTTQKGRQSRDSQALGQTERNRWQCSI
jgi:hypothetical protein